MVKGISMKFVLEIVLKTGGLTGFLLRQQL